jgi:hypothetical protein
MGWRTRSIDARVRDGKGRIKGSVGAKAVRSERPLETHARIPWRGQTSGTGEGRSHGRKPEISCRANETRQSLVDSGSATCANELLAKTNRLPETARSFLLGSRVSGRILPSSHEGSGPIRMRSRSVDSLGSRLLRGRKVRIVGERRSFPRTDSPSSHEVRIAASGRAADGPANPRALPLEAATGPPEKAESESPRGKAGAPRSELPRYPLTRPRPLPEKDRCQALRRAPSEPRATPAAGRGCSDDALP